MDPATSASGAGTAHDGGGFLGVDHAHNERRTWIVTAVCILSLLVQVVGGYLFRSMALTASGLHMAAHVASLLVASGAYALGRRLARDPRFAFGAGKIGYLAGFANAVVLAITAVMIGVESVERLFTPEAVDYASALPLAGAGLVLNLLCVWLLRPTGATAAHHDHEGDINIAAAHLHLSADAIVSVLAIGGLLAGEAFGWRFADPLAGLVGAGLVAQFAASLLRRAAGPLLDMGAAPALADEARRRLEADGERLVELRLWRLGPGHHAAVVVIEAERPLDPQAYRARLGDLAGLSHVTVEVRRGYTTPVAQGSASAA